MVRVIAVLLIAKIAGLTQVSVFAMSHGRSLCFIISSRPALRGFLLPWVSLPPTLGRYCLNGFVYGFFHDQTYLFALHRNYETSSRPGNFNRSCFCCLG